MPRKPLADAWGFNSRCFVCNPENGAGLRQQFFLDEEAGRVVADFTPAADHSGAPNYAHGGVSMALLDDAMAWAVIALNERFGLTQRVEVQFLRPVTIGKTYSIQAWVESADGRALVARAELRDSKGRTCVTARGTYMAMTLEEAVAAIGPGSRAASAYTEESP